MDPEKQDNIEQTQISQGPQRPTEIGQFKIQSQIGSGGMGEVYLAIDTQLQRQIALKILPRAISADPDTKARFLREAQTAAALNHPNVVTIYQIGEFQDQPYIAMEYIEGLSLRDIMRSQRLPQEKISDYLYQICDGLSAAHEKKIVHRDIKPANILVNNLGRVKLLDFGLAKFQQVTGLTSAGMRLGTVSYMSPEQAQGAEVDHRSDIFSLGVVLYEMLTGALPFYRDSEISTLFAIVHQRHPQLLDTQVEALPEFAGAIDRALEKDPANRYQSIREFMTEIWGKSAFSASQNTQAVQTSSIHSGTRAASAIMEMSVLRTAVKKTSIAVLPFDNLGPTDQEYFAAGITEEITTNLSKLKQLRVISHNSARHFAKTDLSLNKIGHELSVDHLLTGSIRWDRSSQSSRFRLSTRLISTTDESLLWAETYDRVLDEIFALQSELAEQITKALGVLILEPELKGIGASLTDNLEAYDNYLKGNEFFPRSTAETDLRKAIQFYVKATELDPNFAVAYARMSRAHSTMYWFHHDRSPDRKAEAKRYAEKAMQLAPDIPESNLAMGYYHYYGELEYDNALEKFAIALKSRPNDGDLLAAVGFVNRRKGNWDQAIQGLRRASTLDPKSSLLAFELGTTLLMNRLYDDAGIHLDRAIWLAPDWVDAYTKKAQNLMLRDGNPGNVAEVFRQAEEKFKPAEIVTELSLIDGFIAYCGDHAKALDALVVDETESETYFLNKGRLARLAGKKEESRSYFQTAKAILEAKVRIEPENARASSFLGLACAGLGEKEKAIAAGQKSTALFPYEKDRVFSVHYRETLTLIYVLLEENDRALEEIKILLSVPSYVSRIYFQTASEYESLRQHPVFLGAIS